MLRRWEQQLHILNSGIECGNIIPRIMKLFKRRIYSINMVYKTKHIDDAESCRLTANHSKTLRIVPSFHPNIFLINNKKYKIWKTYIFFVTLKWKINKMGLFFRIKYFFLNVIYFFKSNKPYYTHTIGEGRGVFKSIKNHSFLII